MITSAIVNGINKRRSTESALNNANSYLNSYKSDIEKVNNDLRSRVNSLGQDYQDVINRTTGAQGFQIGAQLGAQQATQAAQGAAAAVTGQALSTGMTKAQAAALGGGNINSAYSNNLSSMTSNALNSLQAEATAAGNKFNTLANTENVAADNMANMYGNRITGAQNQAATQYNTQDFASKAFGSLGSLFSDENTKDGIQKISHPWDKSDSIIHKNRHHYSELCVKFGGNK